MIKSQMRAPLGWVRSVAATHDSMLGKARGRSRCVIHSYVFQQVILHELHRLTIRNSANGVSGALPSHDTSATADLVAQALQELK